MYIWREWDLYLMSCIFTTFGYKAGYIIAEEGNPPTLETYGQMWLVNKQRMSLFQRLFSQSSQANEFKGGTRDHEATEAVKVAWWLCYACKFGCAVRCIIMQSLWFKWMLPKKLLMYSLIFHNFLNKNHNAVALMKTDFDQKRILIQNDIRADGQSHVWRWRPPNSYTERCFFVNCRLRNI